MQRFEYSILLIKNFRIMIKPSFHMCQRYAERILDKGENYSESFVKSNYNFVYTKILQDYSQSSPIYYGSLEEGSRVSYLYTLYRETLFVLGQNGTGVTVYKVNVDNIKKIPELIRKINEKYNRVAFLIKSYKRTNKVNEHLQWYVNELENSVKNEADETVRIYLENKLKVEKNQSKEYIELDKTVNGEILEITEEIKEVISLLVNGVLNITEYIEKKESHY